MSLTLADASSVINIPELNQFDPWKTPRYPAKFPQFPWNCYLQFRRNNQAPETTYREITFLRYAKKFPGPRRFSNFSFALSVGRDPSFRGGCYSETREKVETEKNWQKRASASEKLFAFFARSSFDDSCLQIHIGCLKRTLLSFCRVRNSSAPFLLSLFLSILSFRFTSTRRRV